MIKSFRSKGLKELFETGDTSKISGDLKDRTRERLLVLHQARTLRDLDVPGFAFHALKGPMKGRFAIKVSGAWRLTFAWEKTDAHEVDLEQYH